MPRDEIVKIESAIVDGHAVEGVGAQRALMKCEEVLRKPSRMGGRGQEEWFGRGQGQDMAIFRMRL